MLGTRKRARGAQQRSIHARVAIVDVVNQTHKTKFLFLETVVLLHRINRDDDRAERAKVELRLLIGD